MTVIKFRKSHASSSPRPMAADSPGISAPKREMAGTATENRLPGAFRRLQERLTHLAQGILGNRMEAEDAVQDAFCKLWAAHCEPADEPTAAALLTTTLRNVSIDHLRRRNAATTLSIEDCAERAVAAEAADSDETPEAETTECRWQRVASIVEQELSPQQRLILHRREYEGADFDTIAREMNMTAAAVRVNLSRARRKILTCYRSRFADEN